MALSRCCSNNDASKEHEFNAEEEAKEDEKEDINAETLRMELNEPEKKAVKDRKYTNEKSFWEALEDGSTVLIKGSWLVGFAKNGGRLPRKQDLPTEAYWTCAALRRKGVVGEDIGMSRRRVQLMALSYCWMEKEHPDPDGKQMQTVAKVVDMRMRMPPKYKDWQCDDVAIFIDYASLPQEPRSEEDLAIFKRGLKNVNLWYAHNLVTVLLLTTFPKGSVVTTGAYGTRGWPSFEKGVASFIKGATNVMDLQYLDAPNATVSKEAKSMGVKPGPCKDWNDCMWKCRANRVPPLTPDLFNVQLDTKTFTNGSDCGIVKKKYASTLREVMGSAQELLFTMEFSGPEAATAVAKCLPYCSNLISLFYDENTPGAAGFAALADALEDRAVCPKLRTCIFTQGGSSGADSAMKKRFKAIFKARKIDSNNGQI